MYIFQVAIQVKYACYVIIFNCTIQVATKVDCYRVGRQLGGGELLSRCSRWSPSSVACAGGSCVPDGPRLGLLGGFPAFCASLCPLVILAAWFHFWSLLA